MTKKNKILMAIILAIYFIIGVAIESKGGAINRPLQYYDNGLDSTVCIAIKTGDWAFADTTTYRLKLTSFPVCTLIAVDDDYNWIFLHRWFWPNRSEVTSEYISFASGGSGTSPWSVEEQQLASDALDSLINLNFRTGATIDASEIGSNAITHEKIQANAIGASEIAANAITINENSAIRWLATMLTLYNGTGARTIYGADLDSMIIYDTSLTPIAYWKFYHPGGSAGDAPDSVKMVVP